MADVTDRTLTLKQCAAIDEWEQIPKKDQQAIVDAFDRVRGMAIEQGRHNLVTANDAAAKLLSSLMEWD